MGRAPCCEKVGLKRGRWTAEEDEILSNYIKANGEGSWRSLPKNAGLLRCGKSCRLRWINYLRADLKRGNFTLEEEELIIRLHGSLGNRWSLIASHLPAGRTDNEIKNYWNSHLRRKIYRFRRPITQSLPVIMDATKVDIAKRKGGRTNRKSNEENKDTCSNKPVDNVSTDEAVPFPLTPLLENETFNAAIPSPCQDTGSYEEGTVDNSMLCPTSIVEEEDDILATLESIESGGLLCFDDILESPLFQENGDSTVPILGDDHVTVDGNKRDNNEVTLESGNFYEDFEGLDSLIDDYKLDNLDWDWENVVEWNEIWDDKNRDMSSLPWETHLMGDNELMMHDSMVA